MSLSDREVKKQKLSDMGMQDRNYIVSVGQEAAEIQQAIMQKKRESK